MKSLRADHTARSLLALQAPHMSRLDPGQTMSAVANDMPSPMFAFSHGLRRTVDRCEGAPVRKRHAELLLICYRTPTRWQGRRHHACVRRRAGSMMRSQRGYRATGQVGESLRVCWRWGRRVGDRRQGNKPP